MNDQNKAELRRLAEAQPNSKWSRSKGRLPIKAGSERMFYVDGPESVSDYEDWGFTRSAASFIAAANPATILSLLDENERLSAEVEALRDRAEKYDTIERVMKMLECDEREGGIWTACTLLLIGSAYKMNSVKSVVDQEGVTVAAENLGNWRVTVERIESAMAKEDSAK